VEFNRNQYFMVGVILLLIGVQLRVVDSYVLSAETTQFLAQRSGTPTQQAALFAAQAAAPEMGRKVIRPPDWIGWCLMSIGSVLILHSLAMKKPD
jgi:hypothetical protein